MLRKYRGRPRTLGFWARVALVSLAAATRLANPERWWPFRYYLPPVLPPLQVPPPLFESAPVPMDCVEAEQDLAEAGRPRGRSAAFCSLACPPDVPAHPGRRAAEGRKYQSLRGLMALSTVQLFPHHPAGEQPAGRRPALVDALYTPATISLFRPDMISLLDSQPRLRTRLSTRL